MRSLAEDVVALMDADWHWKPEHRALVRALEEVRQKAVVVDDAAIRGLFAMSPPAVTYFTSLQEALARVDEIEAGGGR